LDWIKDMSLGQVETAPGDMFGSAAVGLLLIGLALAVRGPEKRVLRELAVLAVAAPVALIGASFVTDSLWVPRYVLVVLPAICLCAAAAVQVAPMRAAAALVLLAGVAAPAQGAVRGPTSHMGPDFRKIAQDIARNQQPGDVIVYGATGTWSLRAGLDYQLRGREKPQDVLLRTPAALAGQLNAVQCADPVACLGAARRIWFFRYEQPGKPLPDAGALSDAGALTATLTGDYHKARAWQATKADLILFER
jgi:mannosyltransferase